MSEQDDLPLPPETDHDTGPRRDGRGTPYDAEKHLPVMHPKTKAWMPRRRKSKPADAPPPPVEKVDFADVEAALDAVDTAAETEAAPPPSAEPLVPVDAALGIIEMAVVLIDRDKRALSAAERVVLRRPLARVLDKYNISGDALPAEVDFAVALAVIILGRLKEDQAASMWAKLKNGVGQAWLRVKAWRMRRTTTQKPSEVMPDEA